MAERRGIAWSALAWLAVCLFWFVITRRHHPTLTLAIIATASLVLAYAAAAYGNFLVPMPRYWKTRRYARYVVTLLGTMVVLTALAPGIIRTSYFPTLGPDPDPNGLYVHFAIDFCGMAVHLLVAAGVVWVVRRWNRIT
jgi:hypothetical protein